MKIVIRETTKPNGIFYSAWLKRGSGFWATYRPIVDDGVRDDGSIRFLPDELLNAFPSAYQSREFASLQECIEYAKKYWDARSDEAFKRALQPGIESRKISG